MDKAGRSLNNYSNIMEWAIYGFAETVVDEKNKVDGSDAIDWAAAVTNNALHTNYKRSHIKNFLRGSKPVPRRIYEFYTDQLIKIEVEQSLSKQVGVDIRRIIKAKPGQ